MYKAVIFDLDNTLVYTKEEYVQGILIDILGRQVSMEETISFWQGNDSLITDEYYFWKRFNELDKYEKRIKFTKVYDDVYVLKELSEKGMKLGVVTNAPPGMAVLDAELIQKEVDIEFDSVVSANKWFTNLEFKPSPQGINQCLYELQVREDEALYIGDSNVDRIAAEKTGVDFRMINRNEGSLSELLSDLLNYPPALE